MMNSNVKVLEMLENGNIDLIAATKLLKAINNNEDSSEKSPKKNKTTKKTAKKKKVKKVTKKVNKKAGKKKSKKKAKKKKKAPLIPIKKGTVIQLDPHGNILSEGRPIGEVDNSRPYQKDRQPGR